MTEYNPKVTQSEVITRQLADIHNVCIEAIKKVLNDNGASLIELTEPVTIKTINEQLNSVIVKIDINSDSAYTEDSIDVDKIKLSELSTTILVEILQQLEQGNYDKISDIL